MFCASKNDPDEKKPNANVCPVCMGHPGTLPVINKKAVEHVLRVGVALGGEIADFTEFDRKNYFYPDIPKGYQISQYQYPLVKGGKLNGIAITRVHLEEDTATSIHDQGDYSLVDFNRAGVPLMELVTEPAISTAKQAADFARELQLLLRYLGVSEANMEKGEMRVEANISISPNDNFGVKVEVKNLNSFRAVERAIDYELSRQTGILEAGNKVIQETRGWDENKQKTFSQRQKEESHDYRYFPDPDLPKLKISEIEEFRVESIRKRLPELPSAKRERYAKEFGIKSDDIEIFVGLPEWAGYFEMVAKFLDNNKKLIRLASNYITSDLLGLTKRTFENWLSDRIPPQNMAKLIKMADNGHLSSRGVKDILLVLYKESGDPEVTAKRLGLIQENSQDELKKIVDKVVAGNPKIIEEYKGGKPSVLQFLIGQGMKESKGSANPGMLKKLFEDHLKT
jgi:aspartyl-tRNA(Asn)/glutamyl-tRNA(Gln) amidotransferase subunit B